ncbi:MAG: hypothetical protein LAT82_02880, partial [Nanoarchaeota archaeon]|nr:hypothetical protein [Nanoarchaeota archaeon]
MNVFLSKLFFLTFYLVVFSLLISTYSFSNPVCNDGLCVQAFNSSTMWNVPFGVTQVDVLLVGGGGGGGAHTGFSNAAGGAGGAGGLIFEENVIIDFTISQNIVIGEGGAGVDAQNVPGGNGGDTIAFNLTALGGGGGILTSATDNTPANNGGSGGGGRQNPAGIATQPSSIWGGFGNDGARNSQDLGGGGGGGAGTRPSDISSDDGGDGGEGLYFGDIFGDNFGDNGWFAGGGGGGGRDGAIGIGGIGGGGNGSSQRDLIVPTNGMPNTGGGGGGGSSAHAGADGGSGVVIIRFQDPPNNLNINQQPQNSISGSALSPSPQVRLQSLLSQFNLSGFEIEVELIGGSFEIGSTTIATT